MGISDAPLSNTPTQNALLPAASRQAPVSSRHTVLVVHAIIKTAIAALHPYLGIFHCLSYACLSAPPYTHPKPDANPPIAVELSLSEHGIGQAVVRLHSFLFRLGETDRREKRDRHQQQPMRYG